MRHDTPTGIANWWVTWCEIDIFGSGSGSILRCLYCHSIILRIGTIKNISKHWGFRSCTCYSPAKFPDGSGKLFFRGTRLRQMVRVTSPRVQEGSRVFQMAAGLRTRCSGLRATEVVSGSKSGFLASAGWKNFLHFEVWISCGTGADLSAQHPDPEELYVFRRRLLSRALGLILMRALRKRRSRAGKRTWN